MGHRVEVLKHTLFRRAHHTRARIDNDGEAFHPAAREAQLQARARLIDEMCNGDWKSQRFCQLLPRRF